MSAQLAFQSVTKITPSFHRTETSLISTVIQ